MGSDDFLPETNIDNGINGSSSSMKDDEQTSSKHQHSFGSNELEAPTTSEIIKFAIPATGIWLCGPLLSLIDTSVVGYFSGTIQQAALNPAIAITDYGGLLVAFMYTATTNLIATARSNDQNVVGTPETKKTLIAALRLALIVGTVFGLTIGIFAPLLLRFLIGKKAMNPYITKTAIRYVRLRAIGMPAAVVIATAQSACLGMKDVKGPLLVIILAGIVNLCGDILFVPMKNSVLGGTAGAAFATSLSQYAALFMFIQWLRIKPKGNREKNSKQQSMSRGILSKDFGISSLWKYPDITGMKKFFPFFLPVTTTAIGRVSGYIAMSNVVSTLGTVEMAAQQIILAFFLCFVPICDSISLTAQSFTPGIFEKKDNCFLEHHSTLGKMVMNFIKVGIGCGILLFALVSCVPMVSHLFTQDFLVQQSMKTAIPYVAGYFALSGLVCAGEGLLLGQKDLSFMGRAYTVYFFAVPYFLLRLKNITSQQTGVVSMWQIFFIYQTIRTSTWLARLFYLRRKDDAAIALHHTI